METPILGVAMNENLIRSAYAHLPLPQLTGKQDVILNQPIALVPMTTNAIKANFSWEEGKRHKDFMLHNVTYN